MCSHTLTQTHKYPQQVQHQTYDQVGNDALVKNFTTRTPVRVFRVKLVKQYDVSEVSRGSSGGGGDGSGGGKEKGKEVRMYVYEGLYRVVEHKREPGKDGFMVGRVGRLCVHVHVSVFMCSCACYSVRLTH